MQRELLVMPGAGCCPYWLTMVRAVLVHGELLVDVAAGSGSMSNTPRKIIVAATRTAQRAQTVERMTQMRCQPHASSSRSVRASTGLPDLLQRGEQAQTENEK